MLLKAWMRKGRKGRREKTEGRSGSFSAFVEGLDKGCTIGMGNGEMQIKKEEERRNEKKIC